MFMVLSRRRTGIIGGGSAKVPGGACICAVMMMMKSVCTFTIQTTATMQAIPNTRLNLSSLPTDTVLKSKPPTDYRIPRTDINYITHRPRYRSKVYGVSERVPVISTEKLAYEIDKQYRSFIPNETIFELTMRIVDSQGNELSEAQKAKTHLKGSVQRAFSDMTIKTRSGKTVEHIRNYDIVNETLINTHMGPDFKNNILATEGVFRDSDYRMYDPQLIPGKFNVTAAAANATLTLVNTTLTDGNPAGELANQILPPLRTYLEVGDHLFISSQDDPPRVVRVTALTGDYTCTLSNEVKIADVAITDGSLTVHKLNFTPYKRVHDNLLSTTGHRFTFQAHPSGIMNLQKHIPLHATGGLTIEFTVNDWQKFLTIDGKGDEAAPDIQVQITGANVYYTAIGYSNVLTSALDTKLIRDGMNFLIRTFHVVIKTVGDAKEINEEFHIPVAMMNTAYVQLRNKKGGQPFSNHTSDSYRFIPLNPKKFFIEFNRVKNPAYGDENDLHIEQMFQEQRLGLNQLGEHHRDLLPYAQFIKNKQHIILNFERFPLGNLTGIDGGSARMVIRSVSDYQDNTVDSETLGDIESNELIFIVEHNQIITLKDGNMPDVVS